MKLTNTRRNAQAGNLGNTLRLVVLGASATCALTLVNCSASSDGTSGSGGSGFAGSGATAASGGSGTGGSAAGGNGGGAATSNGGNGGLIGTGGTPPPPDTVNDPPAMYCGPGAPPTSDPIGGSAECPDDKNYENCLCAEEGAKAPCWPGFRKHKNKGACQDGETTCTRQGESILLWGECVGFTGIDTTSKEPFGTTGAAACECFSGGFWNLENTSPCFYSDQGGQTLFAVSTIFDGTNARCPSQSDGFNPQGGVAPTQPWSKNTVRIDCSGQFKLCYTLRALAAPGATPAATDCTMKQVCAEGYYDQVGQGANGANGDMPLPDLPGWITDASELGCAQAFVSNGGYAEMSVEGMADDCNEVDKVFQTVNYCPIKCNDPGSANDPECINCTTGGGGPF